jgi:GGDEF domain-containing protein
MFSRVKRLFKILKDNKELSYLAYHDPLTDLLNRNWLYKNITKIDKKFVYFLDINNLHEINKNGHTTGDEHIKMCVKSINLNKDDIFIRYAGDEFIIFSDKADLIKCNKLFSVGVSLNNGDLNNSINLADKNMLENKFNI